MKSNKKNDKKESATQQLLNLKQFVPLQIGDSGAVAIEGEDGMLYTYIIDMNRGTEQATYRLAGFQKILYADFSRSTNLFNVSLSALITI